MSRVDDEREAQRVQERLLQKQRQEASRTQQKNATDSAFARKMQESTTAKSFNDQKRGEGDAQHELAKDKMEQHGAQEVLHANEHQGAAAKEQAQSRGEARAFQQKLNKGGDTAQAKAGQNRALATEQEGTAQVSRSGTENHGQKRNEDEAQGDRGFQKRNDGLKKSAAFADANAKAGEGGELRADGDSQKGGGDKKDDQEGKKGLAPSFRLNPALMAPVPVAQPKQASASERLRELANEIAQKIVERVRIGTNAAGAAEFQIDLKSNVLSGLSIKVSGGNGKIKALFQGRDREVLKMLQDQSEGLKAALKARGLVLEEFKIEARG